MTNPKALLRYALPIDNKPIRSIQRELEAISAELRVPGGCSRLAEPLPALPRVVGRGGGHVSC